jgi:hypothetical protein
MSDILSYQNEFSIPIIDTSVAKKEKITIYVEAYDDNKWFLFKTYPLKVSNAKRNSLLYYLGKSDCKYPIFYNNSYWNLNNDIKQFFKNTLLPEDSFYLKTFETNIFDELSLCWTTLEDLENYPWNDNVILEHTDENYNIIHLDKLKFVFSYIYHMKKLIKEDIQKDNKIKKARLIVF